MIKGRNRHSCGFLRQNDRNYVVAVGGNHEHEPGQFAIENSVECLDVTEGIPKDPTEQPSWTSCPPIPKPLKEAFMLTYDKTGSVILIGGTTLTNESEPETSKDIYELSEIDGNWNFRGKLKDDRCLFLALLLPDDDNIPCDNFEANHLEL